MISIIVLLILMILLMLCQMGWLNGANMLNINGFTPSKKPLEQENMLFMNNPFDDMDYQTPMFYKM